MVFRCAFDVFGSRTDVYTEISLRGVERRLPIGFRDDVYVRVDAAHSEDSELHHDVRHSESVASQRNGSE